jgi:hypothetical protein
VPTRGAFLVVSYFPNFEYIPKLTENIFADFSEFVYLPYHIPPLFFMILECSRRFLRGAEVSRFGKYIKHFFLPDKQHEGKTESGRCPRWATRIRPRLGCLARPGGVPLLGCLLGCFLFSYFIKNTKTDKNNIYGILGVRLLTVSHTSFISAILECSERTPLCVPPVSWFE